MGFLTAGLLTGLGNGLVQQSQQMREDALLKLRRQYQLEDQATAEQQAIAKEDRTAKRDAENDTRDYLSKASLLGMAQEFQQKEGETKQQYAERLLRLRGEIESSQITQRGKIDKEIEGVKFSNEKALASLKAGLDRQNDAASQRLKRDLERGVAKVVGRTPEGNIIVQRGDTGLITTNVKMAAPGSGGGDSFSIEDAVNGGKPAAPAAVTARPAAAPAKAEPKATLRQLQNSVDAMLSTGSIPEGQQVGQTLTAPDGTVLTWDGKRWKVPSA